MLEKLLELPDAAMVVSFFVDGRPVDHQQAQADLSTPLGGLGVT